MAPSPTRKRTGEEEVTMPSTTRTCTTLALGCTLLASLALQPPPASAQAASTREASRDAVRACSTPAFGPAQEMSIGQQVRDHIAKGGLKNLDLFGKYVWVYFHVIHDGEEGLLPEEDV